MRPFPSKEIRLAVIKPFRAIHFDRNQFPDVSDLTAPPYDVINDEGRDGFYDKHDYNIIRLILGKPSFSDDEQNNVYTRASRFLNEWQDLGVLTKDKNLALYMYEQRFKLGKQSRTIRGFVGRVRLEEFDTGTILPHEKTLQKPKDDRLLLLSACRTNLSQIYGLYSDPKSKAAKIFARVSKGDALLRAVDDEGTEHLIFSINDKKDIESLEDMMKDKDIFIADGHHRYETALAFRDIESLERKIPASDPVNFTMMMLVNMDSEDMTILPTHRLLRGLTSTNPRLLLNRLTPYFEVIEITGKDGCSEELVHRLRSQKKPSFGLYLGKGRCYLLKLIDFANVSAMIDPSYSQAWRHLDVTILHEVIIENILGFSAVELEPKNLIRFVKDEDLTFRLVDDHEFQIAFLLNPTKIDQIKEIAQNHERMPQKSTHFYPKLLSGLLLNPLS